MIRIQAKVFVEQLGKFLPATVHSEGGTFIAKASGYYGWARGESVVDALRWLCHGINDGTIKPYMFLDLLDGPISVYDEQSEFRHMYENTVL